MTHNPNKCAMLLRCVRTFVRCITGTGRVQLCGVGTVQRDDLRPHRRVLHLWLLPPHVRRFAGPDHLQSVLSAGRVPCGGPRRRQGAKPTQVSGVCVRVRVRVRACVCTRMMFCVSDYDRRSWYCCCCYCGWLFGWFVLLVFASIVRCIHPCIHPSIRVSIYPCHDVIMQGADELGVSVISLR